MAHTEPFVILHSVPVAMLTCSKRKVSSLNVTLKHDFPQQKNNLNEVGDVIAEPH